MKRAITLVIVMVMLLCFTACGLVNMTGNGKISFDSKMEALEHFSGTYIVGDHIYVIDGSKLYDVPCQDIFVTDEEAMDDQINTYLSNVDIGYLNAEDFFKKVNDLITIYYTIEYDHVNGTVSFEDTVLTAVKTGFYIGEDDSVIYEKATTDCKFPTSTLENKYSEHRKNLMKIYEEKYRIPRDAVLEAFGAYEIDSMGVCSATLDELLPIATTEYDIEMVRYSTDKEKALSESFISQFESSGLDADNSYIVTAVGKPKSSPYDSVSYVDRTELIKLIVVLDDNDTLKNWVMYSYDNTFYACCLTYITNSYSSSMWY
ncbi:MAG: hypothetical protein IJB24_00660 [Clostridia bacterium]|nr:hypothetical protein [Clostridia bacterium]